MRARRLLIGLAAACLVSTAPAEDAPASEGRRAQLESYLRSLRHLRPQEEQIGALIESIQNDPGDKAARGRLNELVQQARESYVAEVEPLRAPFASREREQVIARSYRALLQSQEGDLAADSFLLAMEDARRGRLITAWDRLQLIRRLGVAPRWMRDELDRHLDETIPEAMRAKLAAMPRELRRPYAAGWKAFSSQRWEKAEREWLRFEALAEAKPSSVLVETAAGRDAEELDAIADKLRLRARVAAARESTVHELEVGLLERVQSKPERAIDPLEALLYRPELSVSSLERIGAGLLWGYSQLYISGALTAMREAYARKNMDRVVKLGASVLTLDPENSDALTFLAKLESPPAPAAATREPAKAEPAPPLPRKPAKAEPPAPRTAVAAAPPVRIVDKAQSEAKTNIGLAAYAADDYARAIKLLEEALDLNPGNERARENLRTIRNEYAGGAVQ